MEPVPESSSAVCVYVIYMKHHNEAAMQLVALPHSLCVSQVCHACARWVLICQPGGGMSDLHQNN